jgi:hypothetical protein
LRTEYQAQEEQSPSRTNWKKHLDDATIAKFQRELGAMGYKYQFITLAGIHSMWYNMFELAYGYARNGMTSYVEQELGRYAAAASGKQRAGHLTRTGSRPHRKEVGVGGTAVLSCCPLEAAFFEPPLRDDVLRVENGANIWL